MPDRIIAEVESARREVQSTHESIDRLTDSIDRMVPRHEAVSRRLWIGIGALVLILFTVAAGALWRENNLQDQIRHLRFDSSCRSQIASQFDVAIAHQIQADGRFLGTQGRVIAALADDSLTEEEVAILREEMEAASDFAIERSEALEQAIQQRDATAASCE